MRDSELENPNYLQISRQQKTLATVSVISGGAIALVGGYLWFMAPIAGLSESGNIEGARRTGRTMVAVGGGLVAVSIPLFISSNKNKKKAELMMGTTQVMHLPQGAFSQMSVGFRIAL